MALSQQSVLGMIWKAMRAMLGIEMDRSACSCAAGSAPVLWTLQATVCSSVYQWRLCSQLCICLLDNVFSVRE